MTSNLIEPSMTDSNQPPSSTVENNNNHNHTPKEEEVIILESNDSNNNPNWYSNIKSNLPNKVSKYLPDQAELQQKVTEFKKSTVEKYDQLKLNANHSSQSTSNTFKEKLELTKDQFFTQAWSVENGTEIVLNVSLNQVSPLFYSVLPPNAIFERRVPNVWFNLSVRPWTHKSTEYDSWSVTWPILALTGPVAAGISILAIPFVALAAGGTALSSLTGFGTSVATAATGSVATATKTSATAVGLVGRIGNLPGGQKVKGKLVEAGKKLVFGTGGELVREKVVKYLGNAAGSSVAAASAAASASAGVAGIGTEEEEERKRDKILEERIGKKFTEVEVTGLDLVQVLKCSTGTKKVDQALTNAFNTLSFKAKGFKTSDNPVLRITGGPELEERGTKQYLVFYPFVVEKVLNISVVPLPVSEVSPTPAEAALMRDTRIVTSVEEAEEASLYAPQYHDGNKEKAKQEVDEKVKKEDSVKEEEKKAKRASWWGF